MIRAIHLLSKIIVAGSHRRIETVLIPHVGHRYRLFESLCITFTLATSTDDRLLLASIESVFGFKFLGISLLLQLVLLKEPHSTLVTLDQVSSEFSVGGDLTALVWALTWRVKALDTFWQVIDAVPNLA